MPKTSLGALRQLTERLPAPAVRFFVTAYAKRNQVVHHIATELAPGVYMMNL
jgi:hypothetical protein